MVSHWKEMTLQCSHSLLSSIGRSRDGEREQNGPARTDHAGCNLPGANETSCAPTSLWAQRERRIFTVARCVPGDLAPAATQYGRPGQGRGTACGRADRSGRGSADDPARRPGRVSIVSFAGSRPATTPAHVGKATAATLSKCVMSSRIILSVLSQMEESGMKHQKTVKKS